VPIIRRERSVACSPCSTPTPRRSADVEIERCDGGDELSELIRNAGLIDASPCGGLDQAALDRDRCGSRAFVCVDACAPRRGLPPARITPIEHTVAE
jgi:hypothetical protein